MTSDDPLLTRHSLIARLGSGNARTAWEAAWERFFQTYEHVIFSTALRHGLSEIQAEEVLQETMIHLLRVLHEGRYQRKLGRFRPFLFATVRWKIGDAKRRWARTDMPLESLDAEPPAGTAPLRETISAPGDTPDEAIEHALRLSIVERALSALVEHGWVGQQRVDLFMALVSGGKSPAEVASAYGIAPNAVHQARHQVQKKLQRMIQCLEEGLDPAEARS